MDKNHWLSKIMSDFVHSYSHRRPPRRRRNLAIDSSQPFLGLSRNDPYFTDPSVDLSTYRPPIRNQQEYEEEDLDCCLPFMYPSFPVSPNENPAKDRAFSLFSHGLLCCQCVRSQEMGISEECGRFDRIQGPGLHCMPWPYSTFAGRVSLRVRQLDITCETQTMDHVFCHLTVSVLYRVVAISVYEAYYRLQSPSDLMQSAVLDVIRSTVPSKLSIDAIFVNHHTISEAVFTRLQDIFRNYGYEVVSSLVTRIRPSNVVMKSMNEMEASRRWKYAAHHQAEANKIQVVRQAEAQAEAAARQGVGLARGRQAIAKGMRDCVNLWTDVDVRVRNPPPATTVMNLLLVTQYMDILTHLSPHALLVEHGSTPELTRGLVVS